MAYDPSVDEFRELLRSRLRERGDLARLSAASGIASHVIGRWRDGDGRPTDGNLKRLAPALGVPYEDLMKMCGYLPGAASARVGSRRQAVLLAQVEKWINAVGPADEDHFVDSLTAQGDSIVSLIQAVRTAVSETGDDAVSDSVSGRADRGRKPRKGSKGPLTGGQLATKDLSSGRMTSVGQHRLLANSRLAA